MPSRSDDQLSRRRFLRFAAGSPLLAVAGIELGALARMLGGGPRDRAKGLALLQQATQEPDLIASAADALDVFDFEPVARKKIPPAHWGYLATGTDDDATIRANREGYAHWDLRARRLVDVSNIDPSVEILGVKWPTPIVINPVGSQRAFHPEGELAVARAAKAKNHLQVLSTGGHDEHRGLHRRARRAGVVSALPPGRLESDETDGETRRARGRAGRRVHGRSDRRQQSRDDGSLACDRHAHVHELPPRRRARCPAPPGA